MQYFRLRYIFPAVVFLGMLACSKDRPSHHSPTGPAEWFSTDTLNLHPVVSTRTEVLEDGDTLHLLASPVSKHIRGRTVRMLAYNGSIPGPIIKVKEGSEITLVLRNQLGFPTILHSHGIRLASAFDGTADVQELIAHGDSFAYKIRFPDPGIYWYHPHYREDYAKELGLYGNFLVVPKDSTYWAPVDREEVLMLDDLYLDSNGVPPFRKDQSDHVIMGRFGNVFLVNGDTSYTLEVRRKEVVRFFVTNSANTRVLNLGLHWRDSASGFYFPRAMRLAGMDNGRLPSTMFPLYELLAPSERMVFEAYFEDTSTVYLMHTIPAQSPSLSTNKYHVLATIKVLPEPVETLNGMDFYRFDTSAHAMRSIEPFRPHFSKPPDKRLLLTVWMDHALMKRAHDGSDKGIEWEDYPHMGMVNSKTNTVNTRWIIRDMETGKENHDIKWTFKTGDKPLIRIYNDSTSMHPMPHPIHFHGQRFLVVRINGLPNDELTWKDTYLVGAGETADILLDASNPGEWMAQCHISEHLESMMMFYFNVK